MRCNLALSVLFMLLMCSIGYSVVLSVSRTDFRSRDPNFDGPAWLVTVSVDAPGKSDEWIIGTISADEIKDPDTGAKAKKDIAIKFMPTKQECMWEYQEEKYSIPVPTEEGIVKISTSNIYGPFQVEIRDYVAINCLDENAYPSDIKRILDECRLPSCFNVYYSAPGPLLGWCRVAVIYAPKVGNLFRPNTLGVKYGAKVQLEADGERTDIKTLYNIGESGFVNVSGWLTAAGEKIAFVELTGSIGSGYLCPFADVRDDWYVVAIAERRYGLAKSDTVRAYIRCLQEELINALKYWDGSHDTQLRQDVDACNSYFYSMYYAPSSVKVSYGIFENVDLSIVGHLVKMVTKTLIEKPILRFIIKADWIGVYIPIPEPRIVKVVTPPKLYTNRQEIVRVYVKNQGETGTIVADLYCEGAEVAPSPQEKSIAENTEDYFEFVVSSALTRDAKIPCTVKVYPKKNPEKVIRYSFALYYEYNIRCTNIGERWCARDKYGRPVIVECTPEGKIVIVERCYEKGEDYICEMIGGVPKCVKKEVKKEEKEEERWVLLGVSALMILITFLLFIILLIRGTEFAIPAVLLMLGAITLGLGIYMKSLIISLFGLLALIGSSLSLALLLK